MCTDQMSVSRMVFDQKTYNLWWQKSFITLTEGPCLLGCRTLRHLLLKFKFKNWNKNEHFLLIFERRKEMWFFIIPFFISFPLIMVIQMKISNLKTLNIEDKLFCLQSFCLPTIGAEKFKCGYSYAWMFDVLWNDMQVLIWR